MSMGALLSRARAGIAGDPTLRTIALATLVRSLGRGVFFTLTTLYFTRIVGLSVTQVALILTVANAVGVAASYIGGHLSDHLSARRLVAALFVIEGLGLAAYTLATSFTPAIALACLVAAANKAGSSTMASIIARGFESDRRVLVRAINRTVLNAGIAIGGGLAGIALLLDTAAAYRVTMALAGVTYLAAGWACRRLPASVDAHHGEQAGEPAPAAHPARDPRYVGLTLLSAVFMLQFAIAEIAMPLWVTQHTDAPPVTVSILLLLNTVLVMGLQIPLSRRTHEIPTAARAVLRGALCMVAGCAGYAGSGVVGGAAAAIATLILAELAFTFGEVLQQSGVFGLAFELAPRSRAGAYQGFFGMGMALAQTVAPLVIAHTILADPGPGWALMAALFACAGVATVILCRGAVAPDRVPVT
ncbi:MFS transporter [Actinomycetota bacterium]